MQASTTTFLFTDIEGSTTLWEREGARMASALARHDVLARAAVEGNRGRIWKMTGDGIYAAFEDAADALNATLTLQRSLRDPVATDGIQIKVRCGLHAGIVEQRDGEYIGAPVSRTTQVMGAGHGGQILVSRAVADQVDNRLPTEATLRDLGRVRLKDLTTPEHIYQVLHPQLVQDFPPLRSLEATPNNLPQLTSSFIGRERELAQCNELLKGARLLTLVGMGGLGKTRLAMQIAAELLNEYPDGVWFVDLAPLADATLVAKTVAQVLGVREEAGRSITETLCAHLKQQKLILILDNCEHVLAACTSLATAILELAAAVRIIATSREVLHVAGEGTYAVLPLALPERNASLDVLLRSEAVQLFAERARLHKPGFAVTEQEAPAVADICARLEGIPLALELAAARMRALSVQDINARLQDRFRLLTSGSRVAMERQQTLRAMVAWSYDMLSEVEQRLLERLSVFAGGFELAAATPVCATEPLAAEATAELLAALADKSLVTPEQGRFGPRFRQLETIRDFARERLAQRSELSVTVARHCNHFFVWAKVAREKLKGAEQAEWTQRLEADLDNVRAAIALALAGEFDPIIAVKIEVALNDFRIRRGYVTEGRKNIRAALARPEVRAAPVAHAWALYVGAALASSQSDEADAGRLLEQCLAIRRELGNPVEIAATLSTLAQVRLHQGLTDDARKGEEEALRIFRGIGDRIGEAICLLHLAEISMYDLRDDAARTYLERSLAVALQIDYMEVVSDCERLLGELAVACGDLSAARRRLDAAIKVCRDAANKRGEASAIWWLGKMLVASGERERGVAHLCDSLAAFRAFEMNAEILGCLEDHVAVALQAGRLHSAVCLAAAIEAARDRLALTRSPRARDTWRATLERARALNEAASFAAAWATGEAWSLDQAAAQALAPERQEVVSV